MQKIMLCLIFVFLHLHVSAFQEEKIQSRDEINATIEQFLSNAEASIKVVDFDKALDQLNTALELAESIDHHRYIALSSSIRAQLYYLRHDYERAATELQRALSIQRDINDEPGLAYSYINYAKIFLQKKNSERATRYLNLAEDIYEDHNNREGLGVIALNRAILMLNVQSQPNAALNLLETARRELVESTNPYEKSRLYYYFGRAHNVLGNYDLALENAEKGLDISWKNEFGSMVMSLTELISAIYEADKEYEQALTYLQASNQIQDSIYSLNREALTSDATARYGLDAMESTLRELSKQNKAQERSLKVNKLTTILSVALITILSLLTLSLYKNNNLRARANELLQKKNTELTKAKDDAEKASVAKAQFLSTITHELRTPLYAVTGLTHLLLEESPTPNQKEHLNSLRFSGEYLLSLINNILDLNKLEAKKVEMLETSFNLKKRISDVLIALKNSAEDKKTALHLEFDPGIPKKLKGDPLKLSQILINLIGNSIKFTKEGDIWVRVKKINEVGQLVFLHFEVEDNGEGISNERQKAIFENFTQGSLQINRKFGGTGLGLSIVKNLLNLLNSEIHLQSSLGEGSKFSFDLQFESIEPAISKSKKLKEKDSSNELLHDKKLLIVEDNKINQTITRKILEKHRVICEIADDGEIAIEKVKNEEFDLILMDIHMPGISGIEATIEIRKFNREIPIIALTAVTLDDNLDEFYLNGFNDIIPKPFKPEEFFQKIRKQLNHEEASA